MYFLAKLITWNGLDGFDCDFSGNIVDFKFANDFSTCRQYCRADMRCTSFSWLNPSCNLKSGNFNKSEAISSSNRCGLIGKYTLIKMMIR